jgi:hypothetical protein
MAAEIESSGTQTATLTTEHTLDAPSTGGSRVLTVDAAALVAGETLRLRIKEPCLSGGTERVTRDVSFPGPMTSEPIIKSPPFDMPHGGTFTLTQTGGTGRSFPWRVVKLHDIT